MSTIKQGIADLIGATQELETRLRTAIKAELDAFHLLTGVTVDSVSVDMYCVGAVAMPVEHHLSSVRVSVPLD